MEKAVTKNNPGIRYICPALTELKSLIIAEDIETRFLYDCNSDFSVTVMLLEREHMSLRKAGITIKNGIEFIFVVHGIEWHKRQLSCK